MTCNANSYDQTILKKIKGKGEFDGDQNMSRAKITLAKFILWYEKHKGDFCPVVGAQAPLLLAHVIK